MGEAGSRFHACAQARPKEVKTAITTAKSFFITSPFELKSSVFKRGPEPLRRGRPWGSCRLQNPEVERPLMRTERAIDHSELADAALVALPEPLPRQSLVEKFNY